MPKPVTTEIVHKPTFRVRGNRCVADNEPWPCAYAKQHGRRAEHLSGDWWYIDPKLPPEIVPAE